MYKEKIVRSYEFVKKYTSEHKLASLGIVIVLTAGGYYLWPASSSDVSVQYGRVRYGTIQEIVSGTGQVSNTSQVELKPKVNANVTQVLVAPGDKVKKGQVLFRLDARDAYKQVRDANLALEQSKISLEKLKNPPEAIDVLTLENAIKKIQASKNALGTQVDTAYANLLSSGLQAIPDVSYTQETAPTVSGTYTKKVEGQIRIGISQGTEGAMLTVSGVATGQVQYSTVVPQPVADTGLYIKFNAPQSSINWNIDVPNKRSTSYLSLYNAYQTALQNKELSSADYDRQIAEYTQKLADLRAGAKSDDLLAQELVVRQRGNALFDANTTLSDYTIVAPFDGQMASVSAQVGLSAVTAASNGATSLGTIVTDKKIALITLNESDIAKVHLGQSAKVTLDAIDGLSATGTVADIDGIGTVTSGVVTYKVKIYFETNDVRVKPGMSVSADIVANEKSDVLFLPSSAIKKDTQGYYVEADDTLTSMFSRNATEATASSDGTASGTRKWSRPLNASLTEVRPQVIASSTQKAVVVPSSTVFTKISVTIGIIGGGKTEILSGLEAGNQVIVKKTTVSLSKTASATPSITSLLRPNNTQQRQTGSAQSARSQ